jgi:catalase
MTKEHAQTTPARDGHGPTLTTRQGHPVHDNQNQRTIGARGPATLENYQFLEKISHFDRERIPERVVHAHGAVAYGHLKRPAGSATNLPRPTPGRSSSRRPGSGPLSRSGSRP